MEIIAETNWAVHSNLYYETVSFFVDGVMMAESQLIKTFDGESLHCEVEEKGAPVWIIATHGLNEHLGRHRHLKKLFSEYFNLFFWDLRGHGQSTGRRSYAKDFGFFTKDLETVVSHLQGHYGMQRYFLYGHSMGGLICSDFVQNLQRKTSMPEKLFLSSPVIAAPGNLGEALSILPQELLRKASLLPGLPLSFVDVDKLSHRVSVAEDFQRDPLTNKKTHSKLLLGLISRAEQVFSRPLRYEGGLYAMIGSEDKIVNPHAFDNYFSVMEKGAKILKVEGGYHELHNEIDLYRKPALDFLADAFFSSLKSTDSFF